MIFLPEKINVGYQERSGTYTGKLAYIIYYDNKGVLRKEKSWNGWRDNKIEPTIFENVPTEGFVLNKKVGGYSTGWDHRQTYCRVYDSRGFEFEITLDNLLYILENTNSIVGKGLEGEFVYGWSGKDLVLIPCDSPDYKEISKHNENVRNGRSFKGKDMILGATYINKDNEKVVYMGRHNYHGDRSSKKEYFFWTPSYKKYRWAQPKDGFESKNSLSKYIIDIDSEESAENYADLTEAMKLCEDYNPYDHSKDEYFYHTLESFTAHIKNMTKECNGDSETIYYLPKDKTTSGGWYDRHDDRMNFNVKDDKFIDFENIKVEKENHNGWYGNNYTWKKIEHNYTIKEFMTMYQPKWKKEYLTDGTLRRILYNE